MRAPIDWRALREKVEAIGASLERTWTPDDEAARRILRQRAAELAIARETEDAGLTISVIELLLANERYCIEATYVREVRQLDALTMLPGAPPFVLGIVSVRGEVVSVVDIGVFFDLPARGLTDRNRILVLRSREMVFGIVADSVPGIRRLRAAEIQPAPPTFTGVREKYLRGITSDGLVVLDGARLIHDESIVVRHDLQEGVAR